ncbi:MAG: hypothetical protein IEMM0008_0562 [bacterium]|nr:MAG: hypothetical protein IEMM0008_0562 [bacterium]
MFYIQHLPPFASNILVISFYFTFIGMVITILLSVAFLIGAFYKHKYGEIPSPERIKTYIDALKDYYGKLEATDIEAKLEGDLNTFFITEFCKRAEITFKSNNQKSKYLHRARTWIVILLVFSFLSIIPFGILYHNKANQQNIKVNKLKKGSNKNGIK